MTPEQQETLADIRTFIDELPAAQQEACNELAEHFRYLMKQAGEPVGTMAMALVGAEMQLKASS